MSGSNQSGDDEHVRELDVDEAFEHWSELAKRLGAVEPEDTWDERADAPAIKSDEHGERPAPPPVPHVETDWNDIASTLGVTPSPEEVESKPAQEEAAVHSERERLTREPDEFFTTTTREVEIDLGSSAPAPSELVPDSWRSIWGESDESTTPRQQEDQAALDRMFGADSSRVYEPEDDERPQYFDLAEDEEEFASEVRFAPRDQPVVAPRDADEEEPAGRRHRRGRRSQSRRRGRRSDSRRSDERNHEQRPPVSNATSSDKFIADEDDVADDNELTYRVESDSVDDVRDDVEIAETESEAKSSRRSRNRKVASWKDAIGHIVDRNLANREREPNDGHRRRRGGGGRRR